MSGVAPLSFEAMLSSLSDYKRFGGGMETRRHHDKIAKLILILGFKQGFKVLT